MSHRTLLGAAAALVLVFLLGWGIGRSEKITSSDVLLASRLIGLDFSAAERDSMVDQLTAFRESYDSLRAHSIAPSVAPSVEFNPLPVGFVPPQGADRMRLSPLAQVTLPADTSEWPYLSVRVWGELIRTRKISSVRLTKFYLARLKRYDPKLHCVVTLTEDTALAQARKADLEINAGRYRGPLHGIPYGAKDLFAAKGYPTTWGAAPFRTQRFDSDAAVIRKLREAGAVLCAKLTLGELAMGDTWFGGMTRNPWDTSQGSSGSSAGSASAVSAGLLPFALGTETLGSIVSPSTVCGVTGIRPTFGRVSRAGAMPLSWTMDKVGPIGRTVEDCMVVLHAIHGVDPLDGCTRAATLRYDASRPLTGLRIGYVKQGFERRYGFRAQDSASLVMLRKLGAQLVPISLPASRDLWWVLYAEGAASFDELTRSHRDSLLAQQGKGAWPNAFRAARFIPAVEYIQAQRLRSEVIAQMAQLFTKIDVYVAPSWGSNLALTNLTGHPCVVVPNGFSARGTPTSISFTSQLFDEGAAATVANAYQQATEWHLRRPKLD